MFLIHFLSQDGIFPSSWFWLLCSFLLLWESSILLATALELNQSFYPPLFKGKFTCHHEPLVSCSDQGSPFTMYRAWVHLLLAPCRVWSHGYSGVFLARCLVGLYRKSLFAARYFCLISDPWRYVFFVFSVTKPIYINVCTRTPHIIIVPNLELRLHKLSLSP